MTRRDSGTSELAFCLLGGRAGLFFLWVIGDIRVSGRGVRVFFLADLDVAAVDGFEAGMGPL